MYLKVKKNPFARVLGKPRYYVVKLSNLKIGQESQSEVQAFDFCKYGTSGGST